MPRRWRFSPDGRGVHPKTFYSPVHHPPPKLHVGFGSDGAADARHDGSSLVGREGILLQGDGSFSPDGRAIEFTQGLAEADER